ncbi:hypothetical protein GGI15_004304 [Coemansia interrupta]|uniref:DUF3533 domain-containing protein n=1 Tax=Coemansia interrupta TaxID=1126814 RepID=A0A9W8HB32_9FUNG|nr:hypothetical protein GGI15_004304 [Coemansia interrupta]
MRFYWNDEDPSRISMFAKSLRPVLRLKMIYYMRLLLISGGMIWAPLCIFFGATYRRSSYLHRINLLIVDLDGGPIGREISDHILMHADPGDASSPVWQGRSDFASLRDVEEWVRRDGWGAIVVNSGASARLAGAAAGYDPRAAITVVANSGRHEIAYQSYVEPVLTSTAYAAVTEFNTRYVERIQRGLVGIPGSPEALLTAVGSTEENVAPMTFDLAPIITLFGFFVSMLCTISVLIAWKMTTFGFFLRAKHTHVYLGLLAVIFAWTLYFSMLAALADSAFRGPHYRGHAKEYTVGRFFSIWFASHAALLANALWIMSWYVLLTPELIGLLSDVTVVTNVVSTLVPVELTPGFYHIFYILPFYNGSQLLRYVFSGGYPRLGRILGILLGEIGGMCVVFFVATGVRQMCVLRGWSDVPGWYHGQRYFSSPVPFQKLHSDKVDITERAESIADSVDEVTSLKDGNLGV